MFTESPVGQAFLAAVPDAMGFGDLTGSLLPAHPEVAGVAPHLEWSTDGLTSRVPPAAARTYFFHDCSEADAAAAARRLTPQPEGGRAVRPRVTAERFGRVPRLYVEATGDRAVIPACQRRMQELLPGAAVATLATGHAPHLSAPDRPRQRPGALPAGLPAALSSSGWMSADIPLLRLGRAPRCALPWSLATLLSGQSRIGRLRQDGKPVPCRITRVTTFASRVAASSGRCPVPGLTARAGHAAACTDRRSA